MAALNDSVGARIDLHRDGDLLQVRGLFVNASGRRDSLAYELAVRRTGEAGTSRSAQSGSFTTAPGQTDTLSTVHINIQPGDVLDLHLRIERGTTLIDDARIRRTMSP